MKPILSKINVFSANEDTSFQFGAYADIDLVAYIIFKSKDSTVYKFGTVAPTGTGLARQFVIKGGVLVNQHDPYYIMIRCRLTGTNTFSEYSDKILFYCHEKPSIKFRAFSDISSSKIIFTPSYSFDCDYTYKTAEGEVINRYEYYLYDSNKNEIKKSQCFYHRDSMKSFYVDGLDNNSVYYVRAKAESVGGYQLDTGFKQFRTKYSEQIDGVIFDAENDKRRGCINLFAKYPANVKSDITHLRFKRKKPLDTTWMTIYEKQVDLSNDLLLLPNWSNGYVSQSGVFITDNISMSTNLIPASDLKSVEILADGYIARIIAYDKNQKFLGYAETSIKYYLDGKEYTYNEAFDRFSSIGSFMKNL